MIRTWTEEDRDILRTGPHVVGIGSPFEFVGFVFIIDAAPKDLLVKIGKIETLEEIVIPVGTLAVNAKHRAAGTPGSIGIRAERCPRRKGKVRLDMGIQGHANLMQVIGTLDSSSRFPAGLDRRKQQSDENANDRDHDQQFHEGKTARSRPPP